MPSYYYSAMTLEPVTSLTLYCTPVEKLVMQWRQSNGTVTDGAEKSCHFKSLKHNLNSDYAVVVFMRTSVDVLLLSFFFFIFETYIFLSKSMYHKYLFSIFQKHELVSELLNQIALNPIISRLITMMAIVFPLDTTLLPDIFQIGNCIFTMYNFFLEVI